MKKILFGIAGVGAIVGVVVWMGLFPIARTGYGYIWYRDLAAFEGATKHFQDVARQKDPSFSVPEGSEADARRAFLNELIVRDIIKQNLAKLDKNSYEDEINAMVADAEHGKDIAKLDEATRQLYGLAFSGYQELVLEPQAEELVLRRHIEASGKTYGDWLGEQAKNTNVVVYFLPYQWRDGALQKK